MPDSFSDAAPGEFLSAHTSLEAARLDCRFFPVDRGNTGRRFLDFRFGEEVLRFWKLSDWPVDGPVTVHLVLHHMLVHSGSPLALYQRFPMETRLDASATCISELSGWCKFLDTMITHDQVDPCSLASKELGVRRIQMACEAGSTSC